MKTKLIDTIVNNEEEVRFRIFEGELPHNKAYEELLSIEKEQRKSDNYFNNLRIEKLLQLLNEASKQ